jgi:hypothetical protein
MPVAAAAAADLPGTPSASACRPCACSSAAPRRSSTRRVASSRVALRGSRCRGVARCRVVLVRRRRRRTSLLAQSSTTPASRRRWRDRQPALVGSRRPAFASVASPPARDRVAAPRADERRRGRPTHPFYIRTEAARRPHAASCSACPALPSSRLPSSSQRSRRNQPAYPLSG